MPNNYTGNITVSNMGPDQPLELRIHGVIGESFNQGGMTSREVSDQLKDYTGDVIEVSINSPGGSAADGIAIYNMLRRHPAEVIIHIDGVAASAASVIAMAGDIIEMSDSAMIMIHDPMVQCSGNAREMRETAKTLDKWAASIATSYRRHFNVSMEEIRDMMARETWLSAEESFELGVVSQLSTSDQPVAALGFLSQYVNAPANLIKEGENVKEEIKAQDDNMEEVKEEVVEEVAEKAEPCCEDGCCEEAKEEAVEEVVEEVVEVEEPQANNVDEVRNELKKYMNAFGNVSGAEWFTLSMSWEECREKQVQELKEEIENLSLALDTVNETNAVLNARLDAAVEASGEVTPVSHADADTPEAVNHAGMASQIRLPR